MVLVDDSLVRGTTSRKIVRMVRNAGAREVHLRISCPPTVSPCYYGVDTPSEAELIAAHHSIEEIRQICGSGFAWLSFARISEEGGSGERSDVSATPAIRAKYPTPLIQIEDLGLLEVLAGS